MRAASVCDGKNITWYWTFPLAVGTHTHIANDERWRDHHVSIKIFSVFFFLSFSLNEIEIWNCSWAFRDPGFFIVLLKSINKIKSKKNGEKCISEAEENSGELYIFFFSSPTILLLLFVFFLSVWLSGESDCCQCECKSDARSARLRLISNLINLLRHVQCAGAGAGNCVHEKICAGYMEKLSSMTMANGRTMPNQTQWMGCLVHAIPNIELVPFSFSHLIESPFTTNAWHSVC